MGESDLELGLKRFQIVTTGIGEQNWELAKKIQLGKSSGMKYRWAVVFKFTVGGFSGSGIGVTMTERQLQQKRIPSMKSAVTRERGKTKNS